MTKNKLKGIFAAIESNEFAVTIGVASRFSTLVRGLKQEQSVQALLDVMQPKEIKAVTKRLLTLCGKRIDGRYSNPWDFAITTYLWILWVKDVEMAKCLAKTVAATDNLWWGKYLADYLLNLPIITVRLSQQTRPVSLDYKGITLSQSVSFRGSRVGHYHKDRKKQYKLAA